MAVIKPFKALRPKKELAEKVASKPYDVISSAEARIEAKDDDLTFLHVVKSEIDLPEGTHPYDASVYEAARNSLNRFENEGILVQDTEDMLYIYSQTMNGRTQYGLVACASVEEYENDLIKKHEFTRKDKEDDRCRHVEICNANTGPVFLTYRDTDTINYLVSGWVSANAPEYSFAGTDGISHKVWVISDQATNKKLVNEFKKIPCLYVADGHHRSASAARVGAKRRNANPSHTGKEEYNYYLAVLFPASHLMIMDYNRVVKDLNGLNSSDFFASVEKNFEIIESGKDKPEQTHEFCMYFEGRWYTLYSKKGTYPEDDPVEGLDVAILQNNLLAPVLGIGDPRTDNRIDFVGGIRGTKELEKRVKEGCAVAFSMFPTTIEELMSVADAGRVMPPKSTWFEPKLKSGLLIHKLD